MTSEEKIVAMATQMNHDAVIRTTWDIIFTDRRVVAIKTGSGSDVGFAIGGYLGSMIANWDSRKRSKALQELPLSEILASSNEKEFFDYTAVESIVVRPRRILSSGIVIKQRGKRRKKYWGKYGAVAGVSDASNTLRQFGAPIK